MLASISKGTTRIKNLLMADDILRTISAFRAMGVRIVVIASEAKQSLRLLRRCAPRNDIVVCGVGMRGLKRPKRAIYLGNSGTTMRILPGILAGQDFKVVLKGDRSLSQRPMARIAEPLRAMGDSVEGTRDKRQGTRPPLKIHGGKLKAIKYKSKIASAQVKSCVLLAGLYADGVTSVTEPVKSRDHTERMLRLFGVRCSVFGVRCEIKGPAALKSPGVITVPGDISSAAFFIVAGCILPNIKIIIKNVGLNPTRTGVIDILRRMGASIKVTKTENRKPKTEPYGNIVVKSSKLKDVTISPREVVRAIDEIPVIMLAACFARGTTYIKGIGELRVKETDRVKSMVTNLRKLGADIEVKGEGCRVNGGKALHGATVSSFGDHRTAMSMLIADLAIKGKVKVTGLSCINKSFPSFFKILKKI